ncbi:MAG: PIN domain-containing protein [Bacteroidota bacterium]|nr:PIN domain-containing protein [Bacteroidota bacterium]
MKKVYFDTNILLDFVLKRKKFNAIAAKLIDLVVEEQIIGFINGASIVSIHYILSKNRNKTLALEFVNDIMDIFEIARLDKDIIQSALNSNFSDFEDALHEFSAIDAGVEIIVTRNIKDFTTYRLQVYKPEQLIKYIGKTEK